MATVMDASDRSHAYRRTGETIAARHRLLSLTREEYDDLMKQAMTARVMDRQGPPEHTKRAVYHRGTKILVLRNEETGLVVDCVG